jgi:capsular polysaccharide export protein
MNEINLNTHKNILFLQGPMGTFFKSIDLEFRKKGVKTFKIGFNVGDWFFSKKDNYTPYRGKKNDWGNFIQNFLTEHKIDQVFLFGDCRFYQRIALQASNALGIEVFVFEEGYIRPNFITMERYGVNDFSHISRDHNFYRALNILQFKDKNIFNAKSNYYHRAWSASIYFILRDLFWFLYPHYEHHGHHNFVVETFFGIRNLLRKYKYMITEMGLLTKIIKKNKKNYYFIPLQTYNDFQIKEHSHFSSIEEFIEKCMYSFSKFAPKSTQLVIKHHPMDRGRKNYTKFINLLAKKLEIKERVIIVHDLHIPSCLKNAIGTITINSTVGISSLYHNTPTLTLGNSIYDIEGLTCKGMSLDSFWKEYTLPDKILFEKFRLYLIAKTQLNGSFYGCFPKELKYDKLDF